jgi:hypothetical protein|tara:strand:+ start:1170 stop:1394 length:225 start_codon:yes stop_codon:yes gene_type:complete
MSLSKKDILGMAEDLAIVWFELGLFEESDVEDNKTRKMLEKATGREWYEIIAEADLGATSTAATVLLITWDWQE